ncbi:MAG: hypothetical protein C4309_03565 [Chloroflexota bacterium]
MINVNLNSVYYVTKAVVPMMVEAHWGRIINIASIAAKTGGKYIVAYTASKHGVLGLTRALALELVPYNITVNAICPGWIDTPLIRGIFASASDPVEARRTVERRQILGRLGTPEEVGEAAAFLASDEASYITGASLMVDNGMTAQLETW